MKNLYVFRGLPGSGKSTLANKLAPLVIEPDMFRYDGGNRYVFDSAQNADVLEKTELLLGYAMAILEMPCLAVAATHVKLDHIRKYVELGKGHGYDVTVVECYGSYGSVHNVPQETIRRMAREFEPLTDEAARKMGVRVTRRDGGDKTWIEWRGQKFPAREVYVEGYGLRTVSVESLERALADGNGNISDPEAQEVDDRVFFYVDDSKIGLPAAILAEEVQ